MQEAMIRICRVYVGSDERSHFDTVEIPVEKEDAMGRISQWISAQGCYVRESPASLDSGWHNASRRQLIVVLNGQLEMEIGTGERRIFRPGDLVLVEDTMGQGHITRSITDQPVRTLFIPLAETS